jgi:dTDP-glucose 4,6-dehydratase
VPAHLIDAWGDVSIIYNIASQSHVDRAIECPGPFVRNNVELMIHVLSLAKKLPNLRLFLHMSTDEVFGPAIVPTLHTEWEPSRPSNPYSASKAAQEALAFSWWRTYGVPIVVTNTMNLYGEMQDREKYLAKVMRAVSNKDVITVHSSPDGTIGSRYYIHARNFADAWQHLSNIPDIVQRYPAWDELNRFNIVGDKEVNNLDLALMIANAMGKPLYYELTNFHATRPGHDLRYALDGSKMAGTGWVAPVSFEESVHRTVEWTLKNPVWG